MRAQFLARWLFADAGGAVLTAAGMFALAFPFQHYIGLSSRWAVALGCAGIGFFAFSLGSALGAASKRAHRLRTIAVANASYCAATGALICVQWAQLTALGVAYLLGEIALVVAIVRFEWRAARGETKTARAPTAN